MSNIDYTFRLNKQVERKIIIDILSQLNKLFDISTYCYVGMGAIYFYDFILMHKTFGITRQISLENSPDTSRFIFNKPYDFIKFENKLSTKYLSENHDWKEPSIIWLDYETSFITEDNDFVVSDLKLIGRNCKKNDIVFFTINSQSPPEGSKQGFLETYRRYISPDMYNLPNTARVRFVKLIQNIWINILNESCEYNQFKFHKICSFQYKDGAEMFTLGGIFTDNEEEFNNIVSLHGYINSDTMHIENINTPNITLKEKSYINAFIKELGEDISSQILPFTLSEAEIKHYIKNYRYIPTYHEGLI